MGRREEIGLLVGLAKEYCTARRGIEPNSIKCEGGKFPYDGRDETSRTHNPCFGNIDIGKAEEVDFSLYAKDRRRIRKQCNAALNRCPTVHALRSLNLGSIKVSKSNDLAGDDVIGCPLFDPDYSEKYFMKLYKKLDILYGKPNP